MATLHDAIHQVADRIVAGAHPAPPDAVPGPELERITTAEAARRLGVSQTQVRRLVVAGKLRSETEERPQGQRIVVLWEATAEAPGTPPHASGVVTDDATQDATGTLPQRQQDAPQTPPDALQVATGDATPPTHLLVEITWLRERLQAAETERAELRRMLHLEQQTVAALRLQLPEGRNGQAPEVATQDATPTIQHVLPSPPRRSWWRRLFPA